MAKDKPAAQPFCTQGKSPSVDTPLGACSRYADGACPYLAAVLPAVVTACTHHSALWPTPDDTASSDTAPAAPALSDSTDAKPE